MSLIIRKQQMGLRDSGDKGNEKNHVYYLDEDLTSAG